MILRLAIIFLPLSYATHHLVLESQDTTNLYHEILAGISEWTDGRGAEGVQCFGVIVQHLEFPDCENNIYLETHHDLSSLFVLLGLVAVVTIVWTMR